MKTTYKEYGCTASITDKQDGTARLIVRNQYGQKVKEGADTMKEFFNLLKANGMIMNLVFFMAVAFMLGAAAGVATAK